MAVAVLTILNEAGFIDHGIGVFVTVSKNMSERLLSSKLLKMMIRLVVAVMVRVAMRRAGRNSGPVAMVDSG